MSRNTLSFTLVALITGGFNLLTYYLQICMASHCTANKGGFKEGGVGGSDTITDEFSLFWALIKPLIRHSTGKHVKQERSYCVLQSRLVGNKEAINSTRNRIYSLRIFYFLFYRRRYFLFVSELN